MGKIKKRSTLPTRHSATELKAREKKRLASSSLTPTQMKHSFPSFSISFSHTETSSLHFSLFMQDPKINSHTRKPWYQRAIEMATQWKTLSLQQSSSSSRIATSSTNSTWFKSSSSSSSNVSKSTRRTNCPRNGRSKLSRSTQDDVPTTDPNINREGGGGKVKKSSSLRVATSSFTRVCLCAPISSYNEVFRGDVPPRRSYSYPRSASKPFPAATISSSIQLERTDSARRLSTDQGTSRRVVFRGKSLRDDVLMKRFVLEEEAMMQTRRRNEMEVIRRRRSMMMRRKKLGPSPLSRMVLADHHHDQVEDRVLD